MSLNALATRLRAAAPAPALSAALVMALVMSLILAGCAPGPPTVRPDTAPEAAERMLRGGDYRAAARAFEELATEQPQRADAFLLEAAAAWLRSGDADAAAETAAAIDPDGLDDRERGRLVLLQSELALLAGDLVGARRLLAELDEELPGSLATRRDELLERLDARRQAPVDAAADELLAAMAEGRFTPELALSTLIELPLADLEALSRAHAGDPRLDPWLELALQSRRHLLDPVGLGLALNGWERDFPNTGLSAAQAAEWLAAFRDSQPLPARVAVLLPGEGALERPGRALREGLVTRWLELPAERRPELKFYYLDDHADAAVSAWFQAREDGADFLIGPLDRRQIDALVALPDPGVPLLLLNHPEEAVLAAGPGTTRAVLALPPEEEAELAAVNALVRGHRRALVLSQDTGWGERVAERFQETFELGGGRIVDHATYRTAESDHSTLLAPLLGLDRSEERIRRLQQVLGTAIESEPTRRRDLDLVFLAARAADARQLRPQLHFFDAGDLPVFSTSHVFAGDQVAPDLEGIQLPAAPWLIDDTPEGGLRREAERRFPELSNPTLSRLHALGRDAASLLPWLEWMQGDPELYLAGATGRLRLADGLSLERDLPWARIGPGRLVILD